MTSLDDVEKVGEEAKEEGQGQVGFKTIAKVSVNFGYCIFTAPPKQFIHRIKNKDDQNRAKKEAWDYGNENGGLKPAYGLITTIHGDNVPTHPEGKMQRDWVEFVNTWHSEDKVGQTLDDEAKRLKGSFKLPYDAVLYAIIDANAPSIFDEPQWCLMQQIPDGFAKAIGNKRIYTDKKGIEKETDRRIYVIEKMYTTKAEAKAEAEQLKASQVSSSGLSPLATDNGWTKESLTGMTSTIKKQLQKAIDGIGVDGSELDGMNLDRAQEYIASNYSLTIGDLDTIGLADVPF